MTDRYVIALDGESELLGQLDLAIKDLAKPDELLRDIGTLMEQNVNLRFRTKTDPNGHPWPPLSKLTPEIYARINKTLREDDDGNLVIPKMPGSLLERTRRMLNSLASNTGNDFVEWGFSVPYGIYHVTGTERNGKPYMPRRDPLTGDPEKGTLGADDVQELQEEIETYLDRLLGSG